EQHDASAPGIGSDGPCLSGRRADGYGVRGPGDAVPRPGVTQLAVETIAERAETAEEHDVTAARVRGDHRTFPRRWARGWMLLGPAGAVPRPGLCEVSAAEVRTAAEAAEQHHLFARGVGGERR